MKTYPIDQIIPAEIKNLQKIYQQFQTLTDPQNKLVRMTAILPFISLAGLLLVKYPNNETLTQIRQDFKEYYEQNHPKKLEWKTADFDSKLIAKLQQLSSQDEYTKPELLEELYSYQGKYDHAHFVTYFHLTDALEGKIFDEKTGIDAITTAIKTRLETEFLPPDNLERHALLNQISDILQNVKNSWQVLYDSQNTEKYLSEIMQFTKNTSTQIALHVIHDNLTPIKNGSAIIRSGIEIEFSSNYTLSEPKNPHQQIAFLKQISADYEARRQLAIKYGKEPLPKIDWHNIILPLPKLFLSDGPNRDESYLNQATFNLITNILKEKLPAENEAEIKNIVATMLPQEALAFLLLFYDKNKPSTDFNFKFDGISNDITEVYELIKNKQFYAKTVDMIQALEVDLFIGEITEEKLPQLQEKFQKLNYFSNFVGWPITKINHQVNFSFQSHEKKDLIDYTITRTDSEELQATISGVGVEILKTIQESLQKIDKDYSIFRDEPTISVEFDAKKSKSQEYFQKEVAKFTQQNPDASAFTIHKKVAGKTCTIRLSKIGIDTIVEVRMLGCNPHNPTSHIGAHDYKLLKTIITTVNNDVQTKLIELQQSPEYQKLLSNKVKIIDGKVAEIPPIPRLEQKSPNPATRVVMPVEKVVSAGAIVALQN